MNSHIIKKQLSAAYRYSYARLALNYYTFYEELCETGEIPEQIKEYSTTFHQILKDFLENKGNLEALDDLRNQVMKVMEVITAYLDCFQIYEYVLNRMERRFQDGSAINESVEEFAERLMGFLILSEDSMIMNDRIQQVVGQLPVRYTKRKFYSMLLDGLSVYIGSERESLENMMYILRTESMVQIPEHMEQGYEELYQILKELRHEDYSHMQQEDYLAYVDKLDYVGETLMNEASTYLLLQDLINDLYVLLLADPHVLVDVSEKQILEKIVSGVLSEFLEGNTSMVEDSITELLYELEGKQEHAMERYLSYVVPEDTMGDRMAQDLQKLDLLLAGSPFVKLDEEISETKELVDRTWLEQQVSEFSKELEQVFAQSAKPVVRAIMAKLLSALPVVFRSADEIHDYIIGSLESCSDMAERETCMELLNQVMVEEDALV